MIMTTPQYPGQQPYPQQPPGGYQQQGYPQGYPQQPPQQYGQPQGSPYAQPGAYGTPPGAPPAGAPYGGQQAPYGGGQQQNWDQAYDLGDPNATAGQRYANGDYPAVLIEAPTATSRDGSKSGWKLKFRFTGGPYAGQDVSTREIVSV